MASPHFGFLPLSRGWNLDHLQTVMRTEFHATAAVDADEGFAGRVQVDGIDRASPGAGPPTNAQLLPDHNAAPFRCE